MLGSPERADAHIHYEAIDMDEWNELLRAARQGLESDEAYQRIQGNHPDGTRNEDYDVLIDMPITKDHAGNKFTGTMKNLMGADFAGPLYPVNPKYETVFGMKCYGKVNEVYGECKAIFCQLFSLTVRI